MSEETSIVVGGKTQDYKCLLKEPSILRGELAQPSIAPKFLVVVICSTRGHAVVWDSFKRNVLDTLPGADLALAVSSKGGGDAAGASGDEYRANAQYVWDVEDPPDNDYTGLYNKIAHACGNPQFWARELVSYLPGNVFSGIGGGPMNAGSGALLYYFRYVALQEILRNGLNKKYTHVVITRSDYEYAAPHPTKIDTDSLWIPQGEDYGGVTDRHTVVPMHLAVKALNIVEEMVSNPPQDVVAKYNFLAEDGRVNRMRDWNPESLLKHYYERQGLKLTRFPRVMFSVRDTTDSQRSTWYSADAHVNGFADNVLVKYPTEHVMSLKTTYELSACASGCASVDSCAWTAAQDKSWCEQSEECRSCVSAELRCTEAYRHWNFAQVETSGGQFPCRDAASAKGPTLLQTTELLTDAEPRAALGDGFREAGRDAPLTLKDFGVVVH